MLLGDPVEHSVLAAFRCVDAITGDTVSSGLTVTSHLPIWQNRSATYVICDRPRGDLRTRAHDRPFDPSSPFRIEVRIEDASGRYLSRRANIRGQSSFDRIQEQGDPAMLFNPRSVLLFPS